VSDGTDLPTQYAPQDVEGPLYAEWEASGAFGADVTSDRPAFSLVIPPPNVTGSLHMGHAFEHSLMDAVVRRRRMQGYETVWLPGMDHAGIATQNVVERQLAADGVSRHDLGRDEFVAKVWQWKAESGGQILTQMRRLGDSVDWSRERFTMDDGLSRAVQTIFARLYADGLIYRAERIINWCPRCHTALSDIEVEHSDDDGELVSISYGPLTVATTRVETMLGDTAVAVHPDDERYAHLVGTEIDLPLTGRRIPVVADAHVDPAFGTGAVKVTPAHDPNDFEIGQRHNLPTLVIMDENAIITAPGEFAGLDRFAARTAVTEALRVEGRIVAEKRPYVHAVGHCSRCRTVVEPRLSLQWFVKVATLAKAAGDAVRDGRVAMHPPEMAPRFFAWVDNLHDWCISRQLWWGHRIPVWYGPDGEVVVVGPDDEPPTGDGWRQDDDVLDTWFSSGLWPFSTFGWPDHTAELERFYPTSVLITGYDILFFWVARMMMFGLYAMDGQVPFRTVALHGMVRDARGKKMSKSFGNVVDPLDWIDRFGADAVRFTLLKGANPGSDVPVGEEWVQGSRNFVNKLWNATRFALLSGAKVGDLPPREQLSVADRWILSRLTAVTAAVDAALEEFEFAKACDELFHFAWDEVCDWYVELAKLPLAEGGPRAEATRLVLGHLFDTLLRLLHPAIPFVTETLWRKVTGEPMLMTAPWPVADPALADGDAEDEVARLIAVVTELRRFRAEQRVRPGAVLPAAVTGDDLWREHHGAALASLARLNLVDTVDGVNVAVPGLTVTVDLSGSVDVAAEQARLARDLATAEDEKRQAEAKLANAEFTSKAPEAVVGKIRDRLGRSEADIARLTAALAALET
jgi:valyl-tRNA synthetase